MIRTSLVLVSALLVQQVVGHGFMAEPPERSSMWRFGFNVPPNYLDNALNCGMYEVQWHQNDGACGVCGDDYALSRPRPNENGGTYGLGIIAREYQEGQTVEISINYTATHAGWMEWRVCPLSSPDELEEQECFDQYLLELADGSGTKYHLSDDDNNHSGVYTMEVKLPAGLTCDHCVMQWFYRDANRWGDCGDGTFGMGCGPQEEYRNCADIAIN